MTESLFSREQLLLKLRQYCAYQERCVFEVRQKLKTYGAEHHTSGLIDELQQENFLNEERFAEHFAGGKFRIKQWGRIKIKYALKQKMVTDISIRKALAQIDETDYLRTLDKLAAQKIKYVSATKNLTAKKAAVYNYLSQKGYESGLIKKIVDGKIK